MTERQVLDRACEAIEEAVNLYIARNDQYNYDDMLVDIRAEVKRAMEDARREAMRGN
jgi:hypothetical protein